jgi:acetyltransferase-like isoleucine patch superfamily enzyme
MGRTMLGRVKGAIARRLRAAAAGPARMGRVRNTDHAFVSGGVFPRPKNLEEAVRLTGREDEGQLLVDVWRQFDTNCVVGDSVLLGLNARAVNDHPDRSRITIGHHSVIRGIMRQEAEGRIAIGNFVYFGDGSLLHAMESIEIGDETLIAHNVNIIDNDSHPVGADERAAHFKSLLGIKSDIPFEIAREGVTIGRRCWLGLNAIVTKGVEIGDETILSAGAVAAKSLPARVLAVGSPAKAVKSL